MNTGIIIGNIISFFASVFTAASSLSHGKKKIYGFQAIQCFLMAVGAIFFGSWSAITTFILCGVRNIFAAYDRLSLKVCIVITVLTAGLGILANNRGLLGLVPVIATVIYSLGISILHSELKIKLNILLNLVLWALYEFFIMDYVSCATDSISAVITVYSITVGLIKAHKCSDE